MRLPLRYLSWNDTTMCFSTTYVLNRNGDLEWKNKNNNNIVWENLTDWRMSKSGRYNSDINIIHP